MPEGLTDAQVLERLGRLERNVTRLADRAGVEIEDPADSVDSDIVELARSGERLQAAKLYAERTGADFVSAQAVVSRL